MKKISVLIFILVCGLLLLCACGEDTDKSIVSVNPSAQDSVQNVNDQATTPEKSDNNTPKYNGIDVDLSSMSGTIAYSQVYDMMYNPTKYEGKIVKIQGPFSAFYSNKTKSYYPAVIIKDATACCAQGIEFVLCGDPAYPSGYPKTGSKITIVGEFEIYYEGSDRFCHLINAVIV